MALFHVHADVISKGKTKGGATGFAQYIAREQTDKATQHARYIERDATAADALVAQGSGGLPAWANAGARFYLMAAGCDRQRGSGAGRYEVALPRGLPPQQGFVRAPDIRATFFAQCPHAWAIHNPIDPEGGEHPHM